MSEIYHILNRGVDKRKIFLNKQDYFRFIHDLFEFNDESSVTNASYYFYSVDAKFDKEKNNNKTSRKLLVDIHAFCLMPNHYHLLVSPRTENGISKFMHKLDKGYSRYFNIKNQRKGALFEGRYKSILVSEESHFYHLPYYIHLNPLDIEFSEWRDGRLRNYKQALNFLDNYRWSSHLDYAGKKNFPSVTAREFLLDIFGSTEKYRESIEKWLKNLELEKLRDLILE